MVKLKTFPFYKQLDSMDCGPSCLRMIAKYHGQHYTLQTLREKCYIDREGVSLKGIAEAAENIGFRTIAIKTTYTAKKDEPSLMVAPLPCIVHWNQNHFIVVYKVSKKYVWIADPGEGKLKIKVNDFLKSWIGNQEEGIALLLEYERQKQQLESQILQNENQIITIDKQVLEWKLSHENMLNSFQDKWEITVSSLLSEIELWRSNTIITAPQNGVFRFIKNLSIGEFIPSNSTIGFIEPSNSISSKRFFSCQIPMEAIGKIQVGDVAKIQLTPFPKEEFGIIEAEVSELNTLPLSNKDGTLFYEAKLFVSSNTLVSNTNKVIPFQHFMDGKAILITKEKRLFERFFDKLTVKILDNF